MTTYLAPPRDRFDDEVDQHARKMQEEIKEQMRMAQRAGQEQQTQDACVLAARLAAQRLGTLPDLPLTEDELLACALKGVALAREVKADCNMTPTEALSSASAAPRAQVRERLLSASWGKTAADVPSAASRL